MRRLALSLHAVFAVVAALGLIGCGRGAATTTAAAAVSQRAAGPKVATAPAAPEDPGAMLVAAIRRRDAAEALRLIEAGADVNYTRPAERGRAEVFPPLFVAAYRPEMRDVARALIARGAHVERGWGGLTPLQNACRWADAGMIEVLLDGGADVNARTRLSKKTALHMAAHAHVASAWDTETLIGRCRALLDHGADVNAIDSDGRTALDWARDEVRASDFHRIVRKRARSEIAALLIARGGRSGGDLRE